MIQKYLKKNKFINNILMICLFLLLNGCATQPQISQTLCNFIPSDKNPPAWVSGSNQLDGYYIGIGQAEKKNDNIETEKMIKQARSMALENLAQNIKTKVKSQFELASFHNEENNQITFSENIQSNMSTSTDITIFDIHQDSLWLDQNKCILWMRLKVAKPLVDNLFMISQAESNYKIANNSELSLKERIQKIEESIDLIKSVDFSLVPSKGQASLYLKKYKSLQSNLSGRMEVRKLVYIVQAPEVIQKSVVNNFVSQLMNKHQWLHAWHDNSMNCHTIEEGLDIARGNQALYLSYLKIKTKITNLDMGFVEGGLKVSINLYNVKTGQLIFQSTSDQLKSLSYDEAHIPWEKMIGSLLTGNSFNSFVESLPKP